MKKVLKGYSTENGSSYDVESIGINFTDKDKFRIISCQNFIKNNSFISNMKIDIDGDVKFFDDNDEEAEWRTIIIQLIVFSNSVYIYTEHKNDSSDYFESEELSIEDILGTTPTFFARKCDATGKGMNKGYCVMDGEKYFSERKYLIEFLRKDNPDSVNVNDKELLEEAYKNEVYYYTEWEDQDDYQYMAFENGELIEIN